MTNWDEQFWLLMKNSSDILLLLSKEGEVRYVSPSVVAMLGYAPEALIGEPIFSRTAVERRRREVSDFIRRGLLA